MIWYSSVYEHYILTSFLWVKISCISEIHFCLRKTEENVSDVTLTKASLPSTAWAQVRGLATLSLAVMKERWVRLFSSALGATWHNGTNAVRHTRSSQLLLLAFEKTKLHIPPKVGWPCWNGRMWGCHWPLGYLLWWLKLCKNNMYNGSKDAIILYMWEKYLQHMHPIVRCCPYPQSPHCPGEGWHRAVWRFPRSRSLWTWGSSELNGSGRIPSHHHVLHSWCSYPGDTSTWFKAKCELLSGYLWLTLYALIFQIHQQRQRFIQISQFAELFQYHGQIVVLRSVPKRKNLLLLSWHAHQHVVKDVVVSLLRRLHMRAHVLHHKDIWLECCVCYHVTTLADTQSTSIPTCRQTRDFSSRYCSTRAPSMAPPLVKLMSMYFPKRLELSFRTVLALPKAEEKTYFIKADQVKDGIQLIMKTVF